MSAEIPSASSRSVLVARWGRLWRLAQALGEGPGRTGPASRRARRGRTRPEGGGATCLGSAATARAVRAVWGAVQCLCSAHPSPLLCRTRMDRIASWRGDELGRAVARAGSVRRSTQRTRVLSRALVPGEDRGRHAPGSGLGTRKERCYNRG